MPPELDQSMPVRLGVVSFVNTLPLIDGLERLADIELRHSVPSLLVDQLLRDEVDIALCSSIDYQRSSVPLVVLPCGLLGCEGATMTVRLYSSIPIERISRVYCDTDSHTSIALMSIVLREQYGISPERVDYDARERVASNKPLDWPEAMLLIGDKVVTDSPPAIRHPYQLDLGAAWHEMTGLPFVFALWMAKADTDPTRLAVAHDVLDHQRRHNRERIDSMIHRRAVARGWPRDLAEEYLKQRLVYAFTEARREAVEEFFRRAAEAGLIPSHRPLDVAGNVACV